MADRKNADGQGRSVTAGDGRLSVWRVAGLTAILVLIIAVAAVLISGRAGRKKDPGTQSAPAAAEKNTVYEISADSVLDMCGLGGRLALILPGEVRYLDEAGNEIAVTPHKYATPVARTAGKNLLLFDRGANSLRIEKNTEIYNEITTAAPIICADVCVNGTYAYVLNAEEGYQSHLYVYSYKGVKLFEWGSASDYVMNVRLAAGGKYVVLNVLTVGNAEPVSRVICFRFGSEEPVFSVEFKDTTVYDLKFISRDNVVCFSDAGIFRIGKGGATETVKAFSKNELNHSAVTRSGLSALSLNLYGNEKNTTLTIFDKRLKKEYEAQPDAAVNMVGASDSAVAAAGDERVFVYNLYGTLTATIEPGEKCFRLLVEGKKVYLLTAGGLTAYSAVGGPSA